MRLPTTFQAAVLSYLVFVPELPAADAPPVDYSRDVKPILSNYCYACHGPDAKTRKAKLRLDVRDEAIKAAVHPGDPKMSELIARIVADDETVMPPASAKKGKLSAGQIEILRRWIAQGAKFDTHWAYQAPTRPTPPTAGADWARSPIDRFVAAKLDSQGLKPAAPADPITLMRRLSFDLTGLPPTPAEADAFVADNDPRAYERLVDRLLASRHFGERMALYWLDLVRYADSGGYHSDNERNVTMYRDYVISAFNDNKRFDQFTIEQLAGDLLPNRTTEQWIASGYNRLLMTTEEGGAQAKEYTAKYAADRVRNVSAVWLASTLGCSECHDHKFDPFTMRDFYSMAAFFADVQEVAVGRQPQTPLPTPEQAERLKQLDAALAARKAELAQTTPERTAAYEKWLAMVSKDARKLPKPIVDALAIPADRRTPQQKQTLENHWRTTAPELDAARKAVAAAQAERDQFNATIPTTLVSMSANPRMIRILPRGNWLDDSGEVMQPAVPGFLPTVERSGRLTRLDLAQWIVRRDNPVTARVFVNRLWKLYFGRGLVRSVEDFGTQGEHPSHPELLDWLAVEFMESGWDVKQLVKLMVNTATYRQSSVGSAESRERDPGNVWLSRQGRWRLDAELVRDNALAVSGLLVRRIGGGNAKPYQPAGYWSFLNFPRREWQADKGPDLYRRGLYTFWQRTFPHPSLLAFDAPTREECTADRPRSSTPLQALVLLNDPIYVEAARVFAERIVSDGGADTPARLAWAFRQAVTRAPRPEELALLAELHARHRTEYAANPTSAKALLSVGDWRAPAHGDPADLAAWTSVARVLLNLHETITRN